MSNSKSRQLLKYSWRDVPSPSLPEWLSAVHAYFSRRGYSREDVVLIVNRQREDVDHIVASERDWERLASVIAASYDRSPARLSITDADPSALRKSYRALAVCFMEFPPLGFEKGIRSLVLNALGEIAAAALFVPISYLVVGALLEGQSEFGPAQSFPIAGLSILTALLILLAYVEGSHISIARLQNAMIPPSFPNRRVVRLHRTVRTAGDASKFFAGRQILVIVIIFFVSKLTSFPHLQTFPFTSVPLPRGFFGFLTAIFVNYGIAGAIFVYWFGQMIPQLAAIKSPTWVLRDPFGELVVRSAKFIGDMRIAAPAEFIARFVGTEADIPPDPKSRYIQVSNDIGWSYLLQKKEWRVTRSTAEFSYGQVVTFLAHGARAFSDVALVLPEKLHPTRSAIATLHRREKDGTLDDDTFNSHAAPTCENFLAGDIVLKTVEGSAPFNPIMEDAFLIEHPVQHFLFRCVFPRDLGIEAPKVTITGLIDDAVKQASDHTELDIIDMPNGDKSFEFGMAYPPVGTRLKFNWTIF
jgi:hypothetical protein